jgi:putative DNA primase/helicase
MSINDLRAVARALGGDVVGRQVVAPGPAHSARDRSLAVWLDPNAPDGFSVHTHALGDDWRACRDYVRSRLGLPSWEPGDGQQRSILPRHVEKWDLSAVEAEANEEPRARTEDDLIRIARALAIWNEAQEPRGTVAEQYLKARTLDLANDVASDILRFHPRCPWRDENTGGTIFIPALVAAFTSIDDDTITAIHRIRVDQQERWPKADRRSVGAISFFPLINGIRQLVILGEIGEASAKAIKICGTRWRRAGRRVRVVMPNEGLSDMNDVLIAERSAS